MKRYIKSNSEIRYYVTNEAFIPLHAQPGIGYTKLQAIERAQREVNECVYLFGGRPQDYTCDFHIIDTNGHYCKELDSAI